MFTRHVLYFAMRLWTMAANLLMFFKYVFRVIFRILQNTNMSICLLLILRFAVNAVAP